MKTYSLLIALCFSASLTISSYAASIQNNFLINEKKEFEISVGHLHTSDIFNNSRQDFKGVPFTLRFGHITSPRNETFWEFSITDQYSGLDGSICSILMGYRRYFFIKNSYAMSYNLAIGGAYLTKASKDLGSLLNFQERIGISLHKYINNRSSISINYSLSHISNANLDVPNNGINSSIFHIGYAFYL